MKKLVPFLIKKNKHLFIFMLVLMPIIGFAYGEIVIGIISPVITTATESSTVVSPNIKTTISDPVIVEASTTSIPSTAIPSSTVISPNIQTTIPDPVIVEVSTASSPSTATKSSTVVSPSNFSGESTTLAITKSVFVSEGASFIPQPDPIMFSNPITKSVFVSEGTFFVPQPDPIIFSNPITKSVFISAGTSFVIQEEIPCIVPNSGDWIVTSSCTLSASAIASANVIVQNNSTITIPSDTSLHMNKSNTIIIQNGSGLLIQSGGKIVLHKDPIDFVIEAKTTLPEYENGDTVFVTGEILEFDNSVHSSTLLTYRLMDTSGNIVTVGQVLPNSDGTFSFNFVTGGIYFKESGDYTIQLFFLNLYGETTMLYTGGIFEPSLPG